MPAPSVRTELANLALDVLGQPQALLDLETDRSVAGAALRRAFWQAWDEVLRGAPWNCARKRVRRPALEQAPAWGFARQFQLPADYMNIQEIDGLEQGEQFRVEMLETGEGGEAVRVIACDLPSPLDLAYTFQLRNPALADALFRGCFIQRLAAYGALPITRDTRKRDTAFAASQMLLKEAQAADGREGSRRAMPDGAIVSERDS